MCAGPPAVRGVRRGGRFPALVFVAFALGASGLAQSGTIPKDRPRIRPPSQLTGWADWEKGGELLRRIQVPPAPILSPEDEAKTFKLAPGYRAELVAAEPMVQCPIFFEFDPDGRIWVIEYQGYMRDLAGSREGEPICRLVVLEDTDGDGRADKQTVYLDKLVMPRSFAFVQGGILLYEPAKLWFCEDIDGDLRCDRRREVGTMGTAGNPQHTANGLRYGPDNWLHCADWPQKYRWQDGKLVESGTIHRGQFGVSFDDAGRFITCYENSALHMDLIPADAVVRNPNLVKLYQRSGGRGGLGVNVNIARDAQEVFPIRPTPAVTLGALELRDDGRLRTYTIVSGTCFYNGDQYPDDAYGNVFVPESGGHLIGRLKLTPGIEPVASRFYPPEQEFLASTDERFRPVNARVGPDGCLYIADMYHGIIEHVIFMVPWLTQQINERKLDQGNDLGRIWRIVHDGKPVNRRSPQLSRASTADLKGRLSDRNGWSRLTAQRLLVERGEPVEAKRFVADEQSARLEALLALGELRTEAGLAERFRILQRDGGHLFRLAALSGLHGWELRFLSLPWGEASDDKRALFSLVARSIVVGGNPREIELLLAFVARAGSWQKAAMLDGVGAALPANAAQAKPIALSQMPELLAGDQHPKLRVFFTWPGAQPSGVAGVRVAALTADQRLQIETGRTHFTAACAACHQAHGDGVPGAFPPLAGSEWVLGDPARLIRIVLQGVYGAIEVKGQPWNLAMPGQGMNPLLDDERLAALLSYVRNAWGNAGSTLDARQVATVREETRGRMLPWTVAELSGIRSEAETAAVVPVRPAADGVIVLPASRARTYGQKLAYRPSLNVLAPWTVADDSAEWVVEAAAGEFDVRVELAADAESAGDRYVIQTEGSQTTGTVASTGDYATFALQPAGTLTLNAGLNRILMRPTGPLQRELADVRSVVLKPVRSKSAP